MIRLLIIMLLIFVLQPLSAQNRYSLYAKRFQGEVWLRWQAHALPDMRAGMRHGYIVQRTTVSKKGVILKEDETYNLQASPIRPLDDSMRMRLTGASAEAALVFGCLAEDTAAPGDLAGAMLKQKGAELCFLQSQVLLMRRYELALYAGLAMMDKTIQADEDYLYTLISADSGHVLATAWCGAANPVLPVPMPDVTSVESGCIVSVEAVSGDYFGYMIERALGDTGMFRSVSHLPFLPVETADGRWMVTFSDSVAGEQTARYRICGLDVFGMPGLWSDTVSCATVKPSALELQCMGDSLLTWSYSGQVGLLRELSLEFSDSLQGNFRALKEPEVSMGKAIINVPGLSGYVRLRAVTADGGMLYSDPVLIQAKDSIPPASPQILTGSVDTNGLVRLVWKSVPGESVRRFAVYKAGQRNHEPTVISGGYRPDTTFTDSVNLSVMRDSMYYFITALDERYNESAPAVIAMAVPDVIPPPKPVFIPWSMYENGYAIRWADMSSHKVTKYLMKRISQEDSSVLIYAIYAENKPMNEYHDTLGQPGGFYEYQLQAADASGNTSEWSVPLRLRFPEIQLPAMKAPVVLNDSVHNRIILMWEYPALKQLSHFRIMAREPDGSMLTLGTCSAGERQFMIYGRTAPQSQYYIRAYTTDGKKSP